MAKPNISFRTTPEESRLIHLIADRAVQIAQARGLPADRFDFLMDLSAVHANGMRLKLKELLEADDFNFIHDVFGIRRHLDRTTGYLKDCFVPRFAESEDRRRA